MGRLWWVVPALLLGTLWAGCLDKGPSESTGVVVGDRNGAARYVPACPASPSWSPNGVCVVTLGAAGDASSEPFIAVHPRDPATVVVAVISETDAGTKPPHEEILQDANRTLADTGLLGPADCEGFAICLYVSTDGAETFVRRATPRVDGVPFGADPTLVWDDSGVLHLVALGEGRLLHAATPDLGATWTGVSTITAEQGVDRPWTGIAADGTIGVVWQSTSEPRVSALAVSSDGGTSWRELSRTKEPCNLHGAPMHVGEAWVYACLSVPEGQGARSRVYRVDRAGAMEILHEGWFAGGPHVLEQDAEGGLMMAARSWSDGVQNVAARSSVDGGRTWSRPVDILAQAPWAEPWTWAWLGWAAKDEAGVVHALVVGGTGEECYNGTCEDWRTGRDVGYVAVDLETGDWRADLLLTPQGEDRERPLGVPGRFYSDDYDSVVVAGDRIVAAWGHQGMVDVLVVRGSGA